MRQEGRKRENDKGMSENDKGMNRQAILILSVDALTKHGYTRQEALHKARARALKEPCGATDRVV